MQRILWLTSTLVPAMAHRLRAPSAMAGPWIACLLDEVRQKVACDLCVVAPFPGARRDEFVEDGVRYVILPRRRRWHYWNYSWEGLDDATAVIDDYKPALIHVHGTEHCLGLALRRAKHRCGSVVSLQGILDAYKWHTFGELDLWDVFRNERLIDLVRMSGVIGTRMTWRLGAKVEADVFQAHSHFLGRTSWDRCQLHARNPAAVYHHVGELLRNEFYGARWNLASINRHTLFFGNLAGAHKGCHTILRALRIIARDFPGVQVRIAGRANSKSGYGRMFINEARQLGVGDRVDFLGFLDASAMARELAAAHVFVSASHIDNSPNSVGEAQVVGVPVVGSYVGGVPEMLRDGGAGLLFPAGDAETLADRVCQVFRDDSLARSLSEAGRVEAVVRHDRDVVLRQLVDAYAAAGCDVRGQVLP
jgi:glycosyltransferase involved in cell wall biosynthesis